MPDSTSALVNQLANPPSPFDMLQKGVGAVTALKDYQAKQAIANAYTQSIDPDTGQVDQGKFNTLMRGGAASWAAGPAMQQQGQAQGAQGEGTQQDVKGKMAQLGAMGQMMVPLLASGQATHSIDPGTVQSTLDQAHQMGLVNNQQYAQWSGQLKGMNPTQAYGFVLGANMGNSAAMQPSMLQTGPTATNINPFSPVGGNAPAGPVTMGLTPEGMLKLTSYLNEPFNYTDTQGRVHNYPTKKAYYDELGINPFRLFTDGTIPAPGTAPTIPPTTAPGAAGPVSTVTTGRQPVAPAAPGLPGGPGGGPAAPAAPNAPTPPAAAPAATPPVPQPPTAPQPAGNLESPTSPSAALPAPIVEKGQKDYAQAQANQQNLPLQLQPLHNAMALLRTNPDLQTGAGQAQWAQAVTSIAAALNLKVPQGSTDLQELTKYLVQNVRAQETGGSTDLDRLQTEAANPNPTTQSRDALQVLLAKQIGVTRLQSAALDYFNSKYPNAQTAAINSGRFNIDTTDWKKKQDPTAWAVDDLAPDQVSRYFQGLSGTYDPKTHVVTGDKQAFINSLRDARQAGQAGGAPPQLPAGVP